MIHYEPVKITIDAPELEKIINNIMVWHYGLPDSIVSDYISVFTSKFWLSLYYFLRIKWRFSNTFYLQTYGRTERQNSTMEAYLWVFVKYKQDDWAKLLPMVKFAYNNTKNASTGHILFELNRDYHPCISYKKEVDPSPSQNPLMS